ncbi:hypothetical protein FQA47_005708 [Oryzias melastigma]|uniref:Uncharacterized protein n=1 Tax=Oryzias melastigma TaxID=30732 RepID=A0A834F1K0_ORYME|nr:hypothetical protein FQA47_005708 [Oryzias melastigma]
MRRHFTSCNVIGRYPGRAAGHVLDPPAAELIKVIGSRCVRAVRFCGMEFCAEFRKISNSKSFWPRRRSPPLPLSIEAQSVPGVLKGTCIQLSVLPGRRAAALRPSGAVPPLYDLLAPCRRFSLSFVAAVPLFTLSS